MAISWSCETTNVNVTSKRANVNFTRTDDETGATWSIGFTQAIIETSEQRTALFDLAWAEWQKELTKQTAEDDFLSNLGQSAKSNLDAREV